MDKLSKKPLYSIAECPSCHDVYTDPRTLPCFHTVCLDCITKWNESTRQCSPQEDASCPLCQKEFVVPAKGFQSLPQNTFISKMLSVVMIANGDAKRQPCDTCLLNEKIPGDRKPAALTFCFDCQERLCERCNEAHSTLKATRSHKTTVLGEKMDNDLVRCPPTRCDEHPDEELKVVCLDCQTTLCMVCCVTKHGGHQTADVNKIAEEYHTWLSEDVSSLRNTVDKVNKSIEKLKAKKANVVEQVKAVEDTITKTVEHMKSKIDRSKEQLLAELGSIKSRKLRDDDTIINKAIESKSLLESLMKYCEELLNKGSSSDITTEAKRLHGITAELMKAYDGGLSSQTISSITLEFNPTTDLLDRNVNENLVGSLLCTPGPTLIYSIPGSSGVTAVATLEKQLFVARYGTSQLEVFDDSGTTLTQLPSLSVPDSGKSLWGLASCHANKCIYVSDSDKKLVHKLRHASAAFRLDTSTTWSSVKWSVGDDPRGLSVVKKSLNVLVACLSDKIQEFSPSGSLLRQISPVSSPWHAVELSNGSLAVSQWGRDYAAGTGVAILSSDGQVIRRYNSATKGGAVDNRPTLTCPRSLAVDKKGFIMVADRDCNGLFVLNPTLSDARLSPLSVYFTENDVIKSPRGLSFDGPSGRLYIGEESGQKRVLVFGNVYSFALQPYITTV